MNKRLPKTSIKNKEKVKSNLPKSNINIKTNNNTVFSFRDFKCNCIKTKDFNNCFYNMWTYAEWSLIVLNRITYYSSMTVYELKTGGNSTRCHIVEGRALDRLKTVLEKLGYNQQFIQQLEEEGFWELTIEKSLGRIFGYFIDNTYYILLFDPNHLIYPDLKMEAQRDLLDKNFNPWHSVKGKIEEIS